MTRIFGNFPAKTPYLHCIYMVANPYLRVVPKPTNTEH